MLPRSVPSEALDACDRVAESVEVRVRDIAAHDPEVGPRSRIPRRRGPHRPHGHRNGRTYKCKTNPATSQRPVQHRHSAIQMPCWLRYTSAAQEARMHSSSGMRLAS